jgi:hypothetical protein
VLALMGVFILKYGLKNRFIREVGAEIRCQ